MTWKRYGTLAAALALVLGVGGFGYMYWNTVVDPRGGAFLERTVAFDPETASAANPDIAPVEPGDVTEPGEKTIGGYEVVSGSGENAMVTYYILPYIDYGGMKPSVISSTQMAADWDIPQGATRRDLTWDECIALMGGEDAVNTHLDWGEYQLSGWAAWNEDGSFWGAYINGLLPNYDGPTSQFEFAVTANQLPPTCVIYSSAVTQEVRGLTVTAEGHDSVAGPEGGVDESTRRVSFMKDGYGYRFDITGTSRALTEERMSRLVARIADKGLDLSAVSAAQTDATYTCPDCGVTIPAGEKHYHTQDETYTCPICGETCIEGEEHSHELCGYPLYDPNEAADSSYDVPPVSVSDSPRSKGENWCGTPNADPAESWEISDGHPLVPEGWNGPSGSPNCEVCGQPIQEGAEHSHHDDHHGERH